MKWQEVLKSGFFIRRNAESPSKQTPLLLYAHIYPILPLLHRPVREIITFAGDIAAILHVELIAVDRTNHISQGIDITISQYPPGMRTFIGKSKYFIAMPADAYLLSIGFGDCNVVGGEVQFVEVV